MTTTRTFKVNDWVAIHPDRNPHQFQSGIVEKVTPGGNFLFIRLYKNKRPVRIAATSCKLFVDV